MSFVVGDAVVFPGKGVGIVVGESSTEIRGKEYPVYLLQLESSRIEVPVNTSRIRGVMSHEDLEEIYTVLSDRETKPNQTTWNRRYREYLSHINSGETPRIASVLRDLEILDIRKNLSFGESKMHLKAKSLVLEEGAYTLMKEEIRNFWNSIDLELDEDSESSESSESESSESESAEGSMAPAEAKLNKLFNYIHEPHDEWTDTKTGVVYLVPESVELEDGQFEIQRTTSLLIKQVKKASLAPYASKKTNTVKNRKGKASEDETGSRDGITRINLFRELVQERIDELFADERALAAAEAEAALQAKKAKKAKKTKTASASEDKA